MFGTLAAVRASGTALAIATDGAAGGKLDPEVLRETSRREATAAAAMLGVVPTFMDFPDGRLNDDGALIDAPRALIKTEAPDLILTHASNDDHGDHGALSDAVRIAANFVAPAAWVDTMMGAGFASTHYVAPFRAVSPRRSGSARSTHSSTSVRRCRRHRRCARSPTGAA
jgi:LmbE family N-acetylglucosaminyl deacetylase